MAGEAIHIDAEPPRDIIKPQRPLKAYAEPDDSAFRAMLAKLRVDIESGVIGELGIARLRHRYQCSRDDALKARGVMVRERLAVKRGKRVMATR